MFMVTVHQLTRQRKTILKSLTHCKTLENRRYLRGCGQNSTHSLDTPTNRQYKYMWGVGAFFVVKKIFLCLAEF